MATRQTQTQQKEESSASTIGPYPLAWQHYRYLYYIVNA